LFFYFLFSFESPSINKKNTKGQLILGQHKRQLCRSNGQLEKKYTVQFIMVF
jgi:hypothetical protein